MGLVLLAKYGMHAVTFAGFCDALGYTPRAVRRHFCDFDELVGDILRDHLHRISEAIGAVPHDAPDRPRAQRAAYVACTRTGCGRLTDAHLLLVRDRYMLAQDEREPIEAALLMLGQHLGGDRGPEVLSLLDNWHFTIAQIETMLPIVFAAPQVPVQATPALPTPFYAQTAGHPASAADPATAGPGLLH